MTQKKALRSSVVSQVVVIPGAGASIETKFMSDRNFFDTNVLI